MFASYFNGSMYYMFRYGKLEDIIKFAHNLYIVKTAVNIGASTIILNTNSESEIFCAYL